MSASSPPPPESGADPSAAPVRITTARPDLLRALPADEQKRAQTIRRVLAEAGEECYLVGGAVRDLLLGRRVGDLDFATSAPPEKVQKLFRRTIPTGIQHGTVTVVFRDAAGQSCAYEVTTYRAESEYSDGRRPDRIEYAQTLEEDLSRRDFTVNALAYDPGDASLIDCFGGLKDIQAQTLRTIGRAQDRFFEDGLRPVRACRFAATLGFRLDPATQAALADPEVQARTRKVAVERFTDELFKGLKAPRCAPMIELLESSGLLYIFLPPELAGLAPTPPESLARIDALSGADPLARLGLWLRELGLYESDARGEGSDTVQMLSRKLKLSRQQARDLEWMGRYLHFQEQASRRDRPPEATELRGFLSKLKEVYRDESEAFLERLAELPENAAAPERLRAILRQDPLIPADLVLGGRDLLERGLRGPAVGEALRRLLQQVLEDPQRNERETLLDMLQSDQA